MTETPGFENLPPSNPHPGTWYIGEFIIAPHARSRGLGSTLYNEVRDQAKSVGATRIDLAVHEANTAALAFWSHLRFRETGRARYRVKRVERPFVLMSVFLKSSRA